MKTQIKMQEVAEFKFTAIHYNNSPPLSTEIEGVEHLHVFEFVCKRELLTAPKSWSAKIFQEICESFIKDQFSDHRYGVLDFEGNSCISLAELLISRLSLSYCSVREAGIGGVEISVQQNQGNSPVVGHPLSPTEVIKVFGGQI